MLFGLFMGDWTILILIPAFILTVWAQAKVSGAFSRYSKVATRSGLTGAEAARKFLDAHGLYNVSVNRIPGNLTDHYDPRSYTLNLSESVYSSTSTAAVGVACHEAGHAVQHAEGYFALRLRMAIIPVCNIGSNLAMPLFILGLLFAFSSTFGALGGWLMVAGIVCFATATLFQLVTLPVEFDASRRALEGIEEQGLLADDERVGAKKVLSAAALTYVAALATALLSLLRLVVIAQNSKRD